MIFQVSDKYGYTLASGQLTRAQRNRREAEQVVARIERTIEIERLIKADRGPRTGTHPVARREPAAVFELPERRRAPSTPMATPVRRPASAAAVAAIWIVAAVLGVMLALGMLQ